MTVGGEARARAPLEVPPTRDLLLIAVAVTAVSTSAPLITAAVAPALAIAFWRNAMATGVLLPLTAARAVHRAELRALPRRSLHLTLLGGLLLGLHFATWVPSLRYTSVASSTALVATQPVWAALVARVQGFAVPRLAWVGIGVALAGAALLTGLDVSVSLRALLGDGLALIGGIFAALYVSVGGAARQTVGTTVYTTLCYGTAAALLLVLCLVSGARLHGYSATTWWEIVALAAGAQMLGHSLFNTVLATTSPTAVSLAILFEVPGATLIAAVALHQHLRLAVVPALVLLLLGVALVIRSGTRAQPLE
jgi:drug/metabolite transporter (DMT)-like permease